MQTWNLGPFPFVENAAAVDDDVDVVFELVAAIQVFDRDCPLSRVVAPGVGCYFVVEFDILVDEVIVICHTSDVVPDLG